jgi:hypothetical protein
VQIISPALLGVGALCGEPLGLEYIAHDCSGEGGWRTGANHGRRPRDLVTFADMDAHRMKLQDRHGDGPSCTALATVEHDGL